MKNKNAVALGRAGGQKTKANMPKDYYKKLQEKSVKARKAKKVISGKFPKGGLNKGRKIDLNDDF